MTSIQIQCTRCKGVFRDSPGRLQDGYSRQCPGCEVILFFTEDSPHPFIRLALRRARRARKEIREAEVEKILSAPSSQRVGSSRNFVGRRRASEREDEEAG